MFKKLLATIAISSMFATSALADYTMVIPKKPGGGTAVWAAIVAAEMEKYLDERIQLRHIPGGRDMLGFNKFHNELQHEEKTIMVSSGTNAVAFLTEAGSEYNYKDYDAIGLMNLTILVGKKTGDFEQIRFPAHGGGHTPDTMALTLLQCGPDKTIDEYIECFKNDILYVKGFNGQNDFRLAYKREELNTIRENPAAWKKHMTTEVEEGKSELWFHHGLLDAETGEHIDDVNYPGMQFETVFEIKWGVAPSGDFYNAYKLVKTFRDGLQKCIWIKKDSPHREALVAALEQVATNPESVAAIQKKVGNYAWTIGDDANLHRDTVLSLLQEDSYRTLIKFVKEGLGVETDYNETIVETSDK